ncbi:hypothetical protein E8E13_007351 [Curvularia kusanoi]|uniref:Uncharacterized protein n=1 Tax=Curvularia kusanoi TaxID=90978 RepID=A0A9P4W634_CURKU|nr:hypothetical protein E8E13_007351 [Curvularia kusanoi]
MAITNRAREEGVRNCGKQMRRVSDQPIKGHSIQARKVRTERTKRNAEASPLLRLPGEIRNMIYSYVFTDLTMAIRMAPKGARNNRHPGIELLHTCRKIRRETKLFPSRLSISLFADAKLNISSLRKYKYVAAITTLRLSTWKCWAGGWDDTHVFRLALGLAFDFLTELPRINRLEVFVFAPKPTYLALARVAPESQQSRLEENFCGRQLDVVTERRYAA